MGARLDRVMFRQLLIHIRPPVNLDIAASRSEKLRGVAPSAAPPIPRPLVVPCLEHRTTTQLGTAPVRMTKPVYLMAIAALAFAGTSVPATHGQVSPSLDEFQRRVLPVVSRTCSTCHSDRVRTAGLSFDSFRDAASASAAPEVWRRALEKLDAGQMPPRPAAPLSPPDLDAVTGWILKLPGISRGSAAAAAAEPGRVTARRLNRAEYNNTIRDLLGVS